MKRLRRTPRENLVRDVLRRYRVTAEPVDPLLHTGIVTVHADDLNRLDQRGFHRARHHNGHPDAMPRQVEPQDLGQTPRSPYLLAL